MTANQTPVTRGQLIPFAFLSASYCAHIGFFNPYLSLWLKDLGLSLWLIGLLTGMQSFSRLFAPYAWAWVADKTHQRFNVLKWCAFVALIFSMGLYWPVNPLMLALILFFMFIHTSPIMPISETAMANLVSQNGIFNAKRYGRVRLWGSMGFLITVLAAGAWFEKNGMQDFPTWTVITLLAVNISIALISKKSELSRDDQPVLSVVSVLKQKQSLLFFSSVFFHVLAHISIYTFLSLYLDSLGYSKDTIGILWAVSIVIEILAFYSQNKWIHRLSLPAWLCVCAFTMVIRMVITAWFADQFFLLIFAQVLHAVTFAIHHTVCISWLLHHFPGRLRARGQALYSVIAYGLTGVLGSLCGGALSSWLGLGSVYIGAVIAAILSCLFSYWLLKQARNNLFN